jgi:hypothetical protein
MYDFGFCAEISASLYFDYGESQKNFGFSRGFKSGVTWERVATRGGAVVKALR